MLQFTYRDKTFQYPVTTAEVTLGQRVAFYEQYGKELDEAATALLSGENEEVNNADETEHVLDAACKTFSFFTEIPLQEVRQNIDVAQVYNIYNTCLHSIMADAEGDKETLLWEWEGDTWNIAPPVLSPMSDMTFNEFLTAKEITRQLQQMGGGRWEGLPYLCAIYLRKEGEEFNEIFVQPDSERLKIMQTLPLNIALAVGFFLSSTMSSYLNTSASFNPPNQKALT